MEAKKKTMQACPVGMGEGRPKKNAPKHYGGKQTEMNEKGRRE